MMSKEILMVADAVSNEKGVSREVIFEAIESAKKILEWAFGPFFVSRRYVPDAE